MPEKARKIVLTGGPCAGKTTIAEVLDRAYAPRLKIVPEAASLLFSGGFPRWPEKEAAFSLQRAIYRVQCELETTYAAHHSGHLLVLDRGTVDGAAYWPDGTGAFFTALGSALEKELDRYDLVIYLESAGREAFETHGKKNPNRIETWEEARRLDDLTRSLWEKHPRIRIVGNQRSFAEKISTVLRLVEENL